MKGTLSRCSIATMNTLVTTPGRSTLNSLETLRIAAAVLVVLTHCSGFRIPYLQPFLGGSLFLGAFGVDIFFVISGVVMGYAAQRSPPGLQAAGSFMLNRFLRLFPLYALATFAATAWLFHNGHPLGMAHILESLFFLPTGSPKGYVDPALVMGWTLRFEMFFYSLVAVGIACDRKIAVPVLAIAASIAAWYWGDFYFGAPLVLEFIAGYLLSMFMQPLVHRVRAGVGAIPFAVGLVLSLALMLAASTGHDFGETAQGYPAAIPRLWIVYPFAEIPRIVAWGIPAALIVYCCLGLERDFRWRAARFGKFTYSVYLLQYFALLFADKLNTFSWMPDWLAFVIGALLLCAASSLSFRYIELSGLALRRRIAPKVPAPAPLGAG
jgi:exopolysaccharide production protein ExoZ